MSLLNRATQLRLRRSLRRGQRQVEAVTEAAETQFEANVIGRFNRLFRVRRFMIGWLSLVTLITLGLILQTLALSNYYQTARPAAGGIYNEGIVGTYSNVDPLFATGPVNTAVSRLVFAGLLKYNDHNQLAGDLASSYSVDPTGKHYTVHLRPDLTWQDGKPLTSADVAFTFQLIQNPDVQSPLRSSWQGITINAPTPQTVTFDLPNAFSAFPYSLVTGIVPQHVLGNVPAGQLRSAHFNTTAPVGAGPFAWQAIQTTNNLDPNREVSLIGLSPFANYAGGKPKLSGFVVHAFGSQDQMIKAFESHDINAMAGLEEVPAKLRSAHDVTTTDFPATAAVMTFFKTTDDVLADKQVRQALVRGADTAKILQQLGYMTVPVDEPLLRGQLAYNSKYRQAGYDPAAANALLDKDGWKRGPDGIRTKKGQQLAFTLYAEDTTDNRRTTRLLAEQWQQLGASVTPILQQQTDFQTTLEFHTYDALLNGISIGNDPDVFAYWDSSQADIRAASRLNFSEYQSKTADASLEAGRTRSDPALRAVKYQPFLKAWQEDAPALGLYQPHFLYISRGPVYGLTGHTLNTESDRYDSVANWEILTKKVTDE